MLRNRVLYFLCETTEKTGTSATRLRYNLLNISGYQHDSIMADTFLSTKTDYAIPRFIKSNRPLSFLCASILTSNLMYQFKTYTTQLKRKMPYQNI